LLTYLASASVGPTIISVRRTAVGSIFCWKTDRITVIRMRIQMFIVHTATRRIVNHSAVEALANGLGILLAGPGW
jgi:hypothetical protein